MTDSEWNTLGQPHPMTEVWIQVKHNGVTADSMGYLDKFRVWRFRNRRAVVGVILGWKPITDGELKALSMLNYSRWDKRGKK